MVDRRFDETPVKPERLLDRIFDPEVCPNPFSGCFAHPPAQRRIFVEPPNRRVDCGGIAHWHYDTADPVYDDLRAAAAGGDDRCDTIGHRLEQ